MKTNFSLLVVLAFLSSACKNRSSQSVEQLTAKVDSLEMVNVNKTTQINDMMLFVGTLSDGLNQIALQEGMLLGGSQGREGTGIDREELKKNLKTFEELLIQQKQRIAQLSDSLRSRGTNLDKLTGLVNYLNKQLDEKNKVIQSLRADIEKKNVSISQLQGRINSLNESNSNLAQKVEKQTEALSIQTDKINEGYVKIGTAKELKAQGILSGGFLKKKQINVNTLQQEKFMKVDIRRFTEIPINSSSPKILSQMPASSYRIEKNGNTSTLYVTDPKSFWSVSNFLIIQTK